MPRKRRRRFPWEHLPQRELLKVRICDLGVTIEGTWLEDCIARVDAELRARRLRLHPHFWLSDEWFSPDDVPGAGIPFYLAHPRLMRLEGSQMLEVEGATPEECLRLLRHEVGHAVQHAYQLSRRRRWQQVFGPASRPYPKAYRPKPASRRYVQHLEGWYAQSHPVEDFAETFAVWLRPHSAWRVRYRGWPALHKLGYVNELMREIATQPPLVHSRAHPFGLASLRMTLGEHYEKKRAHYQVGVPTMYDRDLRKLFFAPNGHNGAESAASFLGRNRREIRELVSKWTGDTQLALDYVLKAMIRRCRELKLVARGPERRLKLEFAILLSVRGTSYLYRGHDTRAM